ncbi:MAG: hypothetical protein J5704_03435 [Paludibacteraceae bacterium]|nr:hypothetical protein [Paludibacteraceae bacterium]
MKQTQFEIRQRSEQMLQQATALWKRSAFSEQLEDLGKDPVFILLMTALAYQAGEMDSEIERIKQEVMEEMTRTLTPYEMMHAIPATAVVEAMPAEGLQQLELNAENIFTLSGTNYPFIPLCRTRLLRAHIKSFVRLDGRRWKISLGFDRPMDNLSGFSFAIRGVDFRDLVVSVNGKNLPLIHPAEYAQLPFDPAFGVGTMLYNNLQSHIADTACADLFARQNVQLFFVQPHADNTYYSTQLDKIDLVLEFSGISDTFSFGKTNIVLNSVLLVNAQIHSATLSPQTPIIRAAGYEPSADNVEQFMHLVCPSDEQLYGDSTVEVRYAAADRFNQASLMRLIAALKAKYHTDYRAFSELPSNSNDTTAQQLQQVLQRLEEMVSKQAGEAVPGVYLILRQNTMDKLGSMDIRYLTTSGAAVNAALTPDSAFKASDELEGRECMQIAEPVPGCNEVREYASGMETARYLVATGDRIVTPSDIRLFCFKELQNRYGITREMVNKVAVSNRLSQDPQGPGYEIVVEIQIAVNAFVKRDLEEKKNQMENMLQKMMEVRSTNIYPISVTITLEESKNDE